VFIITAKKGVIGITAASTSVIEKGLFSFTIKYISHNTKRIINKMDVIIATVLPKKA
jgi:hypothetical protein